jgi:hypothetical protein
MLLAMLIIAGFQASETTGGTISYNTPADEVEQEAAGSGPLKEPEQAAPATNTAAAETARMPTASTPVDTIESVSSNDAAQIYAAASRQTYSVNFSFGEPGEPPELPLAI